MAWGSPSDIDPLPPPYPPHIGHFVRSKRGDNPKSEVFVKKFLGKNSPNLGICLKRKKKFLEKFSEITIFVKYEKRNSHMVIR